MIFDVDDFIFDVVVNDQEQFSIWPRNRAIPGGWHKEGSSGTKAACIAHIDKVWRDMRPLTLRRRIPNKTLPGELWRGELEEAPANTRLGPTVGTESGASTPSLLHD